MTAPLIKIVPVGAERIPVIRDIAYRTWPVVYGDILVPEQIEYMLGSMYNETVLREQIEHHRHEFLLASELDQPVGYLGYELNAEAAGVTRIHKLYVLPDMQGRGVGHALMKTVIAAAASLGQWSMRLNVNRYNPAVRFYERQGFVTIGEEDLDCGAGYYMNDYVMERRIDPA